MPRTSPRPSRVARVRGVSLLELLIVLAIIGIMMGMLLPALHQVHMHSLRTACDSNVHQLSIALSTYAETHRAMPTPPDPECPVGWTLAVLPYMEESSLADLVKVGQPRTSVANLAVASKRPALFVCPATPEAYSPVTGIGVTNYIFSVDPVSRTNSRRAGWVVQDAPEGARNPWTASPEIPWDMRGYPPPHPTAFGL
jgi:prepilin-type N-terminal cleavage/methylation domain-containing protein